MPDGFSIDLPPGEGVFGGSPVATCAWPSTVSMEGQCSGTLVHPEVVIFAQHCGTGYKQVRFGEKDSGGSGRSVPTEFCKTYSGGGPGSGHDFAFCKLAQPVTDVPIVPILMGCETDILQPGQDVTIVGFGFADDNSYGTKREVVAKINKITGDQEAFIGGGGKDSCNGDSGGPVFVQLADGSWRVFGITSYGGECGTGGYYSMMHIGMEWFEEQTGIDLTPCHDADGTWNPTIKCGMFPMSPATGGGSWMSSCEPGPLSGYSMTCGQAANSDPDDTPPTATILDPIDGMEYDDPNNGSVAITIQVDAQDEGWGVQDVQLIINGEEVMGGVDPSPPYEFPVKMPTGQWTIGAKATDYAGNVGYATEVHIGVNTAPAMPDPTTSTTGDSGTSDSGSGTGGTDGSASESDGSTSGTGGTGGTGVATSAGPTTDSATTAGEDTDEGGCACRSSSGGGSFGIFGLLALAGLRRRRGG
ncbi:MAG: trypsin-like serine protease [Nannocystaceae bacterium]